MMMYFSVVQIPCGVMQLHVPSGNFTSEKSGRGNVPAVWNRDKFFWYKFIWENLFFMFWEIILGMSIGCMAEPPFHGGEYVQG